MFNLGQIVATPGVIDALEDSHETPAKFLDRHSTGDWGDLGVEDKQLNQDALEDGTRILSAYHTNLGEKFWIITEADRSATTLLLPEEY